MRNWTVCAAALSAVAVLLWAMRRRRARRRAPRPRFSWRAFVLSGSVAHAAQIYVPTSYIVSHATEIVTGTVTSAEGRWGQNGRIYTDVVVEVADTAKGTANKASTVTFTVIGRQGRRRRHGSVRHPDVYHRRRDHPVPLFRSRQGGSLCTAASGGKQIVYTDTETGEKYVKGTGVYYAEKAMSEDKKAIEGKKSGVEDKDEAAAKAAEAQAQATLVPLGEYMDYLRGLASDEARTPAK